MDQIQGRLKAIQQILENDVELRAATERLASVEKKDKEAAHALKESEAEVEKQRIKIEQTESSLYGGHVQNPKELQDLQKEVAALKRYLETLEERQLEAMLTAEATENDVQNAQAGLELVHAKLKDQHQDLTQEIETLQKDLERLNSERQAVAPDIEEQSLHVYEKLRVQKRGIAVTTVSDRACEACGTTLTPSQQQIARSSSQLFYCPTCGRILYATN